MKRKRILKKILVYMLCLVMVISGSMTALATNTVSGGDVIASEEQIVTVCSTCNTFPCVCEPTESTVSSGDVVTGDIEEVITGDGGDVITDSSDDAVCEACAKNPCICEEKAAKLESLMQMLPQGAEVPADCTEIYTYTAEEGSFEVVVCAPEGALPEGAELVAELLEEESDAYAQAEATIAEEHEYDGMVALDIHFELNGEEVEPEKAVYVCMNVVGLLPENAVPESVAVHHIAETETNLLGVIPTGTATSVEVVADSTEETGIVEVGVSSEEAALDMTVSFGVESFSVFVTTYDKATQTDKENSNVKEDLYYVGMRQKWKTESDYATGEESYDYYKNVTSDLYGKNVTLPGQLVSCLDYAKVYNKLTAEDKLSEAQIKNVLGKVINVQVNEELPDEYGSDGLVLGLDGAESIEIINKAGLSVDGKGWYKYTRDGDPDRDINYDEKAAFDNAGYAGATFLVGTNSKGAIETGTTLYQKDEVAKNKNKQDVGKITAVNIERDENGKISQPFGVKYVNIGTYMGHKITLEVTVTDYAINENDKWNSYNGWYRNALIGLKASLTEDEQEQVKKGKTVKVKPGIMVYNVAWVELTYKFYDENGAPVNVYGNTTYYDIDEFQAVFLDETCEGIFVTDGDLTESTDPFLLKNGESKDAYQNHNKCVLSLGWFDEGVVKDENGNIVASNLDADGFGVYTTETQGVSTTSEFTSRAFTEVFHVEAGQEMKRIFSFQNENYGDYNKENFDAMQSSNPSGTIYHSGVPVIRKGDLKIRKLVAVSSDGVRDTETAFDFTMTVTNTEQTIADGVYGDLYFESGEAYTVAYDSAGNPSKGAKGFKLKHGESVSVEDLPAGTTYTVTEIEPAGYTVTVDDNDPNKDNLKTSNTFTGTIQATVDVKTGFLPEVTFTNTEKNLWQIAKQGSGNGLYLSGAKFTLQEQVAAGQSGDVYYGQSIDDNDGTNELEDGLIKWYTDEACTIPFTGRMPSGTYTLTETKAPTGYSLSDEVWTLVISNGVLTITSSNGAITSSTSQSGAQTMYTYCFNNVLLYELPSTGGSGTYWYTISGLMLMLGAALIMHRNKYKEVLRRQ